MPTETYLTLIVDDEVPILDFLKKMFEKVAYEKWSGRKVDQWLRFELNFKSAGN